jgi:hypothetical protein
MVPCTPSGVLYATTGFVFVAMVMNSVIIMRAMHIVCVSLYSAVPSTSMSNHHVSTTINAQFRLIMTGYINQLTIFTHFRLQPLALDIHFL